MEFVLSAFPPPRGVTMKEKDGSPRKTSPRKSNKLIMDVNIKTQMKRRADVSRAAVKERQSENKEAAKKKEVTFDDNIHEKTIEEDGEEAGNHSTQEETPRDPNTSVDSIKDEDNEQNSTLEGDSNKTPREGDGEDDDAAANTAAVEGDADTEKGENSATTTSTADKDKESDENNKDKESDEKKEEDEDKEDKKGGKKGKKKGGGGGGGGGGGKGKPKKEVKKKVIKPKPIEMPKGEVTAGTDEFRTFIFDKVQSALEIVCTDGVTETTVDNVTPLLKSLDVDTSDEALIDLMRDALVDNFGVINPLDLDQVVQKAQEANELTEMDDCLEVAFKLIDFDEDEFITQKDIHKLGLQLGEELAEFALDEMVAAADMDQDGKISLRDFRYFLLGRDVPSRKEIFAMAEAARKKREEEEERKRQEEEKKENERQAKLYQKIKDGEIIGTEGAENAEESKTGDSGEEGDGTQKENESAEKKGTYTTKENNGNVVSENVELVKPSEEEKEVPAAPKTEAELLREKRKNMFAGYAKAIVAANVISNQSISEMSPRVADDENKNKIDVKITNDNDNDNDNDDDNNKGRDVFENNNNNDGDDNMNDSHDDDDRGDSGPLPLQTTFNLNLPPPDLSTVSHAVPSPLATPVATPRRPTIVGIGGLGLSPSSDNSVFQEAIQRLEEDMFKGDNLVPERPRRRRSTCASVDEPMIVNSSNDVEDYNNRLVFKLPPLRRPSCTPPSDAQRRHSGGVASERRRSSNNSNSKCAVAAAGTDSDEGIDLADEEMVEPTVIQPCGAAAPSVSLRISLPHGHDGVLEGAGADYDYDADRMKVSIVTRKGRRRSSSSSATVTIDERGVATLGVGGLYGDTPRSMSRSDMSVTHISLVSPRLTDDDEDEEEDDNIDDDLETTTSKAAVHTTSNTSGYDCDNDSIALSLFEDENEEGTDPLKAKEKLSHYKKGRLKKAKLKTDVSSSLDREISPTPSLTRRKVAKSNKTSLSCQKIEIKELALNEPIPVGQFSNRHKFGMIPRDVSKFIVLGKNPVSNDDSQTTRASILVKDEAASGEPQHKKSASVRWKELPDMIRPILKQRRNTSSAVAVREHSVLQGRRLSLFHELDSSVMKNKQAFDWPILPNKIQIPTGNETLSSSSTPNPAALDNIRKMERKILKRCQTSFELPTVYDGQCDINGIDTARSDLSNKSRRSSKSRPVSARRKSSPVSYLYDSDGGGGGRYSARNRKISIVDLSKSLRRESACRNTASLSKKHSGFKSIVPLARVVMAYQSTKKKHRDTEGFYSISRQLEKSGVPFNSTTSTTNGSVVNSSSSSYYSPSPRRAASSEFNSARFDGSGRKRRCKSARGRSSGGGGGGGSAFATSSKNSVDDLFVSMCDDDVHTLVRDLKDPDVLPAHVVFQKVRPATAHAGAMRNVYNSSLAAAGGMGMSGSKSNIVTLEIPETKKFEKKKLKNVSLLSKLPIK